MPAKVIVIGLDACEATILEEGARSGAFETFRGIIESGPTISMSNAMDTLPGSIWPEIATGRSGGRLGQYFHPQQIHTGESRLRPLEAIEQNTDEYYWSVASGAGRRVAVVDQPQVALCDGINGLHVLEWGCHDRTYSVAASPAGLMDEITSRYGAHPVHLCDRVAYGRRGLSQPLTKLTSGLETKEALLSDLLGREDWDLFTCSISESHCVGHHFWSHHDPSDPWHDPAAGDDFKNAIKAIYGRIDQVVGRLIQQAGPDAKVVLFTSHGMGPYIGGYQLLSEFLTRLGLSSDQGKAQDSRFRSVQNAARRLTPLSLRSLLKAAQQAAPLQWLQTETGSLLQPLTSDRARAAAVPNNRVGAIRLNVAGREPFGCVEPGAEKDELIAKLRHELLLLMHPETGLPIVESVVTPSEAFGEDHHPDLPDLMVAFRRDQGSVEACQSEAVGTIRFPIRSSAMRRTGDHTDVSRLWMPGQDLQADIGSREASVQDIAPTVLSLLDVAIPPFIEGKSLVQPAIPAS